jgi:aspartyl-tRNA(Asn)/glutamyl-tRNA(Gln) amidotransferase subunit C
MITVEEVRHIARLARVKLAAKEEKEMTGHLQKILDYFHKLSELDTTAIKPTVHAVEVVNMLREDKPSPSLPVEKILENAPEKEDDFFTVPKIVGQ